MSNLSDVKKVLKPRAKSKIQSVQSTTDDETHSYDLHNILSIRQMFVMKDRFERQPGRRMSKEVFRKILHDVAHLTFTNYEFDILCNKLNFTRISSDVFWEEFLTHIRVGLDSENVDNLTGKLELPITGSPKELKSHHRLTVTKIIFFPEMLEGRITNNLHGVYLTCSRDGLINYWSMDMEKERTVYSKSPQLISQQTWITDLIALPDVSVVCTSSTERDLRFYDTTAKKFELRVIIQSFDDMVTAMYYTFYQDINKESKLILGNATGKVRLVLINVKDRGPFKSLPKRPLLSVTYNQFVKGQLPGMRVTEIPTKHTDWVRQVSYYENIHCVVSISCCSVQSMLIHSSTFSKDSDYTFKVAKGFTCFTIAAAIHMIITGGPDLLVRVWNPFVPSRALTVFRGHHADIVSIVLQDDSKILVTLDKFKCIKVWDIAEQTCLQSYYELPSSLGERTALCTYYNPCSRQLFVASQKIVLVQVYPLLNGEYTDGISHSKEVSVILFNELFKTVVTCGFDSFILIWNPWQGKRIQFIRNAHTNNLYGEIIPVEITAATFDPSNQLLITGASDGTLKVWNFIVKTCIRNMSIAKNCEIYSIVWLKFRILVMGENRAVTEFADLEDIGSSQSKSWVRRHSGDILCAATYMPQMLITGSYSGELVFWRMETAQPYAMYNVSNPSQRITKQYQATKIREKGEGKMSANIKNRGDTKMSEVLIRVANSRHKDDRRSINAMICLSTRPVHPQIGTLLVALDNSLIQMWSIHSGGGYLTEFNPVHNARDYVVALCTDAKNKYLFTGHMLGYIKTWHLINYGVPKEDEVHVCMPKLRLRFPFMWKDTLLGRAKRAHRSNVPILLNSFKAHLKPVTSMIYVDKVKMIMSSSSDGSARAWTLGGRYLGTLGTFKPWSYISPNLESDETREYRVPADIQRSASFTTFKVLTGGKFEKSLTKKQQQQQYEQMAEDVHNVYGKRVNLSSILGNHFKLPVRGYHHYDIMLDTNLPEVPIYSELVLPEHEQIKRPPTPELMRNLKAQTQLTSSPMKPKLTIKN